MIQLLDRDEKDYSTVFVFNLGLSIFLYTLLYLSSPIIAEFYDEKILEEILPVLGLLLIIRSFEIVNRTRLIIEMNFKALAWVNFISTVFSGVIAVFLAYNNMGVWALVAQQLSFAGLGVILLVFFTKRIIRPIFSLKSFKKLFGFSSRLLVANLYATGLNNLYSLVLGKFYSSSDLGYYNRAKNFSDISSTLVGQILQKVAFPHLSSFQKDKERFKRLQKSYLRLGAMVSFPSMVLLSLLAEPLIVILLGEKWIPAISILQILAMAKFFHVVSLLNINSLNSLGRSDLFLKVDLLKGPIVILLLYFTIPFGIEAIVTGQLLASLISFILNATFSGRLYGYGFLKQLKDLVPFFVGSIVLALVGFLINLASINIWLSSILTLIVGVTSYFIVLRIYKVSEIYKIKQILLGNSE